MPPLEEDWLPLSLVQGVWQKAIRRLLDHFGGIGALLEASAGEIAQTGGLDAALAARIARAREVDALRMERRLIAQYGVRLLCLDQPEYPPLLRQIHVPPPLLY